MKIGDMRHRITFEEKVELPDGYKGFTVSWQTVITVWALIEPLSGQEYFYAHQVKAGITHRVKTRYTEKVTTEMRIKHGERYFKIESILNISERHEFLEILCKEGK